MAKETTTKFKVDITELKANIKEANRQIALANSEFKKASAGMENWAKEADGLTAKIEQLNSVTDSYEEILEELRKQYEKVVQEQGENSAGADELKIKMNGLEASIKGNRATVAKYQKQLEDLQNSQEETVETVEEQLDAYDQLKKTINEQKGTLDSLKRQYSNVALTQGKSSQEAQNLADEIDRLNRELEQNKSAMKDAEHSAERLEDAFEDVEDAVEDVGDSTKSLKDGFTVVKGAIASLIADGVKSLVSNIANLASETREYRTEMSKLETAFTSNKLSAEQAKKTYKDFYAILGDEGQAVEAVNFLSLMTKNEQDLAKWTNIAAGVYGQFGASLPIEGLTEAANETAKVGQVTGPLADALNWTSLSAKDLGLKLKANTEENKEWNQAIKEGASSEDLFNMALSECSNEQERQALIMNTLNKLYSDSATKFKENNKEIIDANKAQSDLTDAYAELGAKAEPIITTIKQGMADLLNAILDLTNNVDLSQVSASIEEGFAYFIDEALPKIVEGIKWVIDNKDTLIGGIVAIGSAMAIIKIGTFVTNIINLIKTVKTATTVWSGLQVALSAIGGPVTLIIAAIAALVAGFMYLWNNCDGFKEFWLGLWEDIKEGAAKVGDWLSEFFTETVPEFFNTCIEWVKKNWPSILLFLINPFAGLFKYFYDNNKKFREFVDNAIKAIKELPGKVAEWLKKTIKKVVSWHTEMTQKAIKVGSEFLSKIVSFFVELPIKAGMYFGKVVKKVISWGVDMAKKGKDAAQDLFDTVTDKIKEIPKDIVSIGSDIVKGLWNGIKDMSGWISGKIKGFGDDVLGGIKDFFGIKSPSKVMEEEVGEQLPAGMAVGVENNAKKVYRVMKNLTSNTVKMAQNDLSNINSNTVKGANNLLHKSSNNMASNALSTAPNNNVVYNFTQNNTSPKALSRVELYRQTKNQLKFVGGV